ncbi:MAG TPA: hypothetical protein PK829_05785 [Promineifilum sp.]|nr:hypothetical protein [Promineifilum sp.]
MTLPILVVTGEPAWTMQALHLAAAMAREAGAPIILVEMIPASHIQSLGAEPDETLLPLARMESLRQYADAVEGYGITVTVATFQCADYLGGLLSACEQASATAVFAPAPGGALRFLAAARLWYLRRALRRPLFTLDDGRAAVWQPRPLGA